MAKVISTFIIILATLFFSGNAIAAEKMPRALQDINPAEIQKVSDEEAQGIRGYFLPPHLVARQELERTWEEWSAQELDAFLLKQEEADD